MGKNSLYLTYRSEVRLINTKSGFQGQSVFNLNLAPDPTKRDFTLTWY